MLERPRSKRLARFLASWVIAVQLVAVLASREHAPIGPFQADARPSLLAAHVPADVEAVPAAVEAVATPTTTIPPPPPPPPPPPRPEPTPRVPASTVPAESRSERVKRAFRTAVPAEWRAAVPAHLVIIDGQTSWAWPGGEIQVAVYHADGDFGHLLSVLAHEFGHLIAFRYGARTYHGAAPEGWPAYSSRPEEAWADCVARATTGINDPSRGLPACTGSSLSWTQGWLNAGPASHPVTKP